MISVELTALWDEIGYSVTLGDDLTRVAEGQVEELVDGFYLCWFTSGQECLVEALGDTINEAAVTLQSMAGTDGMLNAWENHVQRGNELLEQVESLREAF